MTDLQRRQTIREALAHAGSAPLLAGARGLFAALGYHSERRVDLDDDSPAEFVAAYDREGKLNSETALLAGWNAVVMVFQLTDRELYIGGQKMLPLEEDQFDAQSYRSFLFFAVDLAGSSYTRTQLARITREINKLFRMPVSVLFRYSATLTLAIVTHRPNRTDTQLDVLEKVSLIRDVRCANPHRAHVEILAGLALEHLAEHQAITSFNDLQRAWARTLDISELNRRFYREIANWYFWAVGRVVFPSGTGQTAGNNADNMIRLITRLIFVWFLKEKELVPDDLFNRGKLGAILVSLEDDASTYYKAILQNLFFATLNQEMNTPQRPENRKFRADRQHYNIPSLYRYRELFRDPAEALQLFEQVPFLNGGLFECLDKRDEHGDVQRVDGFSDRPDNPLSVPNYLFFHDSETIDLNAAYGTRGRRYEVRGLIDILQGYKFTIAENTPIEEDVALDPELLGQVFENLLAAYNPETETTARKETGSFYTPRRIVDYMVDESLLLYLLGHLPAAGAAAASTPEATPPPTPEERLRELLAYTETAHRFGDDEVAALIAAIDRLAVIDPACGSGAFPMGVLHKLVYVLTRLDPRNARWKKRQLDQAKALSDPETRSMVIESIEEAFGRNELDYGRKLYLIEKGIYGVDIQPVAVQIAKLRCFIALIVDQQVDDTRENRGIRPLPNLETRFVAADTLRGLEGQRILRSPAVLNLEAELDEVRASHFSARTPRTKEKYRERDAQLRAELGVQLANEGMPAGTAALLAQWNPYDQNQAARFFDPEWMFGRAEGFDIVIANPPYVRQEQITERKPQLARQFPTTYSGTADLYVFFYERAVQLLEDGGVLTFISSNKYFRAAYGQRLRRFVAGSMAIRQLIDFGDAPVFTAIAYPSIIIAQKARPEAQAIQALNWNPAANLDEFPRIFRDSRILLDQKTLTADGWRLEGTAVQQLLDKLRRGGTPLGTYVGGHFYMGIKTGLNDAFVVDRATRDRLIAEDPAAAEVLKPFVRGRHVKRWRVAFADEYLIKIESSENKRHPWSGLARDAAERIFAQTYPAVYAWFQERRSGLITRDDQGKYFWELRSCAYWDAFLEPKILYPDIFEHQSFAYDVQHYYAGNTCYFVPTEQRWMTGLFNSRAIEWFYSQISNKVRGGYMRAFSDYMRQVPIPVGGNTSAIDGLVQQILEQKQGDPRADVTVLEQEIDERVYALYALRPDEIRMIEELIRGTPARERV